MKTTRLGFLIFGAAFLALVAFSVRSDAHVEVGVRINIPVYTFAAPPPLAVIPGTYAYFVPDINVDVLFYHGYWYRPYQGRWYRAGYYNGPWGFIEARRVPRVLTGLPPDYRLIAGYRRIPYREFDGNWRRWERNGYWERDEWWRAGVHREHR